jgi:hypothetical protein
MVKLINGYWTDENNNRWSEDLETEESAQKKSEGMVNCRDCLNCDSCDSCDSCNSCNSCNWCDSCDSCNWCNSCRSCNSCNSCRSCRSCNSCNWCDSCDSFKSNPNRYTGLSMGSRHAQTTTYWTSESVQVVCGCFRGNLDEFESKVNKTHGDNEHGLAYRNYIKIVRMIMANE